ncbi:MAG: DUF1223 domain-containing protein [Pseudoxanthomonas sp.]
MSNPLPVVMSMLLLSVASNAMAADACVARSGARAMPLVELYTSEGCSSCPPADHWLSQQIGDVDANFLAFHVDYWDDIGWPDRFASAQYSQRQRTRVGAVGQSTVYTPQVMVGSVVQASWRSSGAWRKYLEQARQPAGAALTLRMQPAAGGWQANIGAAAVGTPAGGAKVWLASYVDAQTSEVRAGENRGVTLHHDRVVRQLFGPWPLPATGALSQQVELPADATVWGITAFVQDARGNVLQSLGLPASDCTTIK